jgi:hypothetical protein
MPREVITREETPGFNDAARHFLQRVIAHRIRVSGKEFPSLHAVVTLRDRRVIKYFPNDCMWRRRDDGSPTWITFGIEETSGGEDEFVVLEISDMMAIECEIPATEETL